MSTIFEIMVFSLVHMNKHISHERRALEVPTWHVWPYAGGGLWGRGIIEMKDEV